MAVYFFDSSALVKCYLAETGTAWVRGLLDPSAGNEDYVLRIAEVEVTSAIMRRSRAGAISTSLATSALQQFRNDLATEYRTIEITRALVSDAAQLAERHGLRAYDALQLAAASELHTQRSTLALSALSVISADQELNAAALAEGLVVDDPNAHP